MVRLLVRVLPNAKNSEIVDWWSGPDGETLRIRLAAPPVDGKANQCLLLFFVKELDLKKSQIRIAKGEKNRQKIIEISGLCEAELRSRIDLVIKQKS